MSDFVRGGVGISVGAGVRAWTGGDVGALVKECVGISEVAGVGNRMGVGVGDGVETWFGAVVGAPVLITVGKGVSAGVGW